jgi:hypothetical protein
LGRGQAFFEGLLEGKGRVQILTHYGVFELGGQAQHVDQPFTMLDDEWASEVARVPRIASTLASTPRPPGRVVISSALRRSR